MGGKLLCHNLPTVLPFHGWRKGILDSNPFAIKSNHRRPQNGTLGKVLWFLPRAAGEVNLLHGLFSWSAFADAQILGWTQPAF